MWSRCRLPPLTRLMEKGPDQHPDPASMAFTPPPWQGSRRPLRGSRRQWAKA